MDIVIYSGSFDPMHTGHACLASWVAQFCPQADELWLMVTPRNPLKPDTDMVSDRHRLAMASLVADTLPGVRVSDFEFSLPRPSYTHSTLQALALRWPQHRFRLLIGSDNWLIFHRWRDHDAILRDFGVLIYMRPGYPVDPGTLPPGATLLEGAPRFEISSTFIRESLRRGINMNYFLPPAVYDYVRTHNLYTHGHD